MNEDLKGKEKCIRNIIKQEMNGALKDITEKLMYQPISSHTIFQAIDKVFPEKIKGADKYSDYSYTHLGKKPISAIKEMTNTADRSCNKLNSACEKSLLVNSETLAAKQDEWRDMMKMYEDCWD